MDTANAAACSKCFKTLTGNWDFHPRKDCKTGRLSSMNGYILSDSPNWISCYCHPCWNEIKANNEKEKEQEAENKKLVEEIQRLTEKKMKTENEFNREIEKITQEKDNLIQDNANLNSMVQVLNTNLTSFNDQFQSQDTEFQNKLSALENEKNSLEKKLAKEIRRLLQEKQTIEEGLKDSKKKVEDLTKEKDDLKREKGQIEAQNGDLERRLNDLEETFKKQVECLTREKDGLKQERDDLNVQKEQLEKEKNEAVQEIDRLMIDSDKLLQYNQIRINAEEFKDYYDCRIKADSFYTLLEGKSWDIEYKNLKEYLELRMQNTTKVAVLGYENTGKSFLVSQLTGFELPQGTLMKTTGICLKFPTKEYLPWTALDTPGTNVSIQTEEMKKNLAEYFEKKGLPEVERMRMLLGDNILMENLLQEFVVKHAQVLLVVVGKLHRDDQRLINRIKSLPGKRIIIVHNLMDIRNKEDVEKMIQEDIVKTFKVTERSIYLEKMEAGKGEGMNNKVYLESYENDKEKDKTIEHIVMAHKGSSAGNYYNGSAITYIKTTITSMPFAKPFDLVEAFLSHLNQRFKYYLYPNTTENEIPMNPFVLENNAIRLNDCLQYDLKTSSADEFGKIQTFNREGLDNILYTVKIINERNDAGAEATLKIDLELVGHYEEKNIKPHVYQHLNNQISIGIKGKSEDNTMKSEKCDILENTRKFGHFNILTDKIHLNDLCINRQEGHTRIKNEVPGVLTFSWNLYKPAE